jgi:Leucine-rich repeat (LRR) protein
MIDNRITGSIPQTLAALLNLEILDLSSNLLSSELPDLSSLQNLLPIDVSKNRLSGNIPISFYSLVHVISVSLASNNFIGSISSIGSRH